MRAIYLTDNLLIGGKYMYNHLTKIIKRIVNKMKTIEFKANMSYLVITLGFGALVAALAFNLNSLAKYILVGGGAIIASGGLIVALKIYRQLEIDETAQKTKENQERNAQNEEDSKSRKELSDAIRELRKTLEQIKNDKYNNTTTINH
jgi:F0F1-type ATP synthase epsilon subunit